MIRTLALLGLLALVAPAPAALLGFSDSSPVPVAAAPDEFPYWEVWKEAKQIKLDLDLDGIAFAVVARGELRISGAMGRGVSGAVDLASISKPLTALLVMRLVEQGHLELDAAAAKFFPKVGIDPRITLRHLLLHTSGLRHYDGVFEGIDEFEIGLFGEATLRTDPGRSYHYSSPGFYLLSCVAWAAVAGAGEVPTKEQFLEQLNEQVARPLGIGDLELEPTHGDRLGAGGIAATPKAMGELMAKLMDRELLSEESYDELWFVQAGKDRGLGFRVEPFDRLKVSHNGSHPDLENRSRMVFYAEHGHGVFVMVHGDLEPSIGRVSTRLYEALGQAGYSPRE